jgi:hypothetical protein
MKNGKSSPRQTGNLVSVVGTFGGVPVSVESYQNEKQALAAYEATKRIHQKVVEEQTSSLVKIDEIFTEKTKGCKTSCSGLPRCKFKPESGTADAFALAVVRGPAYASVPSPEPCLAYIAVNRGGKLDVTGFRDPVQMKNIYDQIRDSHKDDPTFVEDGPDDQYAAFNTEDISVAWGIMDIVPKGGRCVLK